MPIPWRRWPPPATPEHFQHIEGEPEAANNGEGGEEEPPEQPPCWRFPFPPFLEEEANGDYRS